MEQMERQGTLPIVKEDSMRPFPWIVRVGLFAVGFGVGLSHYRAPSTQQLQVIEIRLIDPGSVPADSRLLSAEAPCPPAKSNLEVLSARN